MNTKQLNQLTMYGAVLRFLEEAGKQLAAIKRIDLGRATLADLVARIGQTTAAQDHTTTEVTRDRQAVKAEAAQKAEILRLLVVALTPDAALRGELKTPLSKKRIGKDADLLAYLAKVDQAIGTLAAQDLTDAGYDPAVRQTLQVDLQELTGKIVKGFSLKEARYISEDGLLRRASSQGQSLLARIGMEGFLVKGHFVLRRGRIASSFVLAMTQPPC